jgi:hypothetical protein
VEKGRKQMQIVRKGLVVVVIVLFMIIAFSPVINASNNTIVSKPLFIPAKENTVSLTVLEYKPDGTIEKSIVRMSKEQTEKLRGELKGVNDIDSRLSIYTKYNLIPKDATTEKLRLGMEEKARKFKPEIKMLQNLITHRERNYQQNIHFGMNLFCTVDVLSFIGLRLLGGSSFITSIINYYWVNSHYALPSIDLFQISTCLLGGLAAYNGRLNDSAIFGFLFTSFVFGFVGYYIVEEDFRPLIFYYYISESLGYAVACLGVVVLPYSPSP